jgi:uncharacterized integral membrane protein
MNQKQKEKWKKIRAKGQSEFVLKEGGLIFGLLLFGLIVPILRFIVGFITNDFTFSFFDKGFQMGIFLNLFFAFPLGCLLYLGSWYWNEFKYSRSKYNK